MTPLTFIHKYDMISVSVFPIFHILSNRFKSGKGLKVFGCLIANNLSHIANKVNVLTRNMHVKNA